MGRPRIHTEPRERIDIISPRTIRRVWALVTKTPAAPVRELAEAAGVAVSTAQAALNRLRDAGYLEAPPGAVRARNVIVPFVEVARVLPWRCAGCGSDTHTPSLSDSELCMRCAVDRLIQTRSYS